MFLAERQMTFVQKHSCMEGQDVIISNADLILWCNYQGEHRLWHNFGVAVLPKKRTN